MMIRPAELTAIKAGTIDLAFRRWARPRVVVGTRMRTGVGLVEVTSVEQVSVASLRAEDARRAGAPSLAALKKALAARSSDPAWRIGLRYAGPDPREEGTPLPRSIGAPATRALREVGVTTLEQVTSYSAAQLAAMHGVGPIAISRLRDALAEQGARLAGDD